MSARIVERAFDRAQLKQSFANVPVGLKLLEGPINPSNASIFQMNVVQSRRYGRYFQIWPGARNNEIEVLSFDHSLTQLVLRVREPRRSYVEVVKKSAFTSAELVHEQTRKAGGRVLKETRYDWRVELWTPEIDRRYLCGRDDIHLFIAQVASGDTVAQAHESLKPAMVKQAEAAQPGCVQRQGEWFFIPVSAEGLRSLEVHLRDWPRSLKVCAPVGEGGRPHVADAVVTIDRRIRIGHREHRRPEVYAQGAVVHPDHRRIILSSWRRVLRNAEVAAANDRLRIRWID